ncbi:hypothetical protein AMQ84_25540 [Paenibacillus riograndensis]|uniref:Uncharacterized protein n=1 Tax=Paenibacillus riograndensis TaxID=483937 RepID=A0A132TMU3_9BACL|nr:hypothetical protein [Paenibacillus riograndensis]KWX72629.1 hypothetical protein AMQ84_25540 [Paenibacillus riograndensis]
MTNNSMKKAAIILSLSIVTAVFPGQAWAEQGTSTSTPANVTSSANSNPYEVAGINDPAEFTAYFAKLQKAVEGNKPAEVADLIAYPLNLNKDNKKYVFYNKNEFIKKYDRVFTSRVRENLLAQKADKVFVNYQGIMVGDGDLWIGKQNNKLGVIAVNILNNPYDVAGINDPIVFEHNFSLLQKNVKEGKKSEVANLMVYPLKVNHNGKTMQIKTKKDFIAKYDKIINAKVKKALLAQKVDKVFVNWKGVMIGNGELWIGQFGEQVGVFVINQ